MVKNKSVPRKESNNIGMTGGNPFKNDPRFRLELSYNLVLPKTRSFLDYGCSDGKLLIALKKKIPKAKIYGFDVDAEKTRYIKRNFPGIKIVASSHKSRLILKNSTQEVVALLDVLEHVPDEKMVLSDIYRVLKPGGVLILSVPHKGLTEVFDAGNVKFRFPGLHRFLYERVFGKKDYVKNYLGKELVGDVTWQESMWHKHYSLTELKKLFRTKFKIEKVYYFGLFFPLLSMLDQAIEWFFKKKNLLGKMVIADSRTNYGNLSFSILIIARKAGR